MRHYIIITLFWLPKKVSVHSEILCFNNVFLVICAVRVVYKLTFFFTSRAKPVFNEIFQPGPTWWTTCFHCIPLPGATITLKLDSQQTGKTHVQLISAFI